MVQKLLFGQHRQTDVSETFTFLLLWAVITFTLHKCERERHSDDSHPSTTDVTYTVLLYNNIHPKK